MNARFHISPKFIAAKGKKNKVVEIMTNRVCSLRFGKVFSSQTHIEALSKERHGEACSGLPIMVGICGIRHVKCLILVIMHISS